METREIPKFRFTTPPLRIPKPLDFSSFVNESKLNSILENMNSERKSLEKCYELNHFQEVESHTIEYLSSIYGFVFPVANKKSDVKKSEKVLVSEGGEATPLLNSNLNSYNSENTEKYSKHSQVFPFSWKTSLLKKNQEVLVPHSLYELYCILYNLAISNWNSLPKDKKGAFQSLLSIAGIFEYLETLFDQLKETHDINENLAKSLKLLCLCEAKEIAIEIGFEKEQKFELFSGIIFDISKKYQNIISMLKSSEILMDLKIFVTYKKRYYDLLGLVFSGICYNEKDENGNALAYLNEAKKQFEDFKKLSKIQKKEAIEKQVEWIEKFIKKNFDKFEQQNKLVYHEKIPDVLPGLIAERNVGQVHPFQYPNASSKWTFEIYDSLNLPNYKMEENEKIESEHQEDITSSDANEKLIKKETKKSEDSSDGIGGCGICEIL